jgi:hypothetical protein
MPGGTSPSFAVNYCGSPRGKGLSSNMGDGQWSNPGKVAARSAPGAPFMTSMVTFNAKQGRGDLAYQ